MKLLQHAWSDMLVLDHIHQRLHVGLPDETTLPNGQKFDLLSLALLGVPSVADQLHNVTQRLSELKLDTIDYICLKFLLLLNPGMTLSTLLFDITHYSMIETNFLVNIFIFFYSFLSRIVLLIDFFSLFFRFL